MRADPTVLIVDDEPEILDMLVRTLTEHHFRCLSAAGVEEGKHRVESEDLDLAVCDLALEDGSGLDLLKYIRCIRPSLPVVIITGFPSIQVAEEALRMGAFDLIEKPFDMDVLIEVVNEAAATRQQQLAGVREMLAVMDRPAVFVDRRWRVLAANTKWAELVGQDGHLAGRSVDEFVAAESSIAVSDLLAGAGGADSVQARVRLVSAAGAVEVNLIGVPFRERREQPGGYLITVEPTAADVGGSTEGEGARQDDLTGCLSQRGFLDALDRMRLAALRRSLPVAVMVADINDFCRINQTYGCDFGDRVLRDVTEHIRRTVRDEDLVGRYGDDEFAVALYEATAEQAVRVADRLCAALAGMTYDVGGVSLSIGLMIGVVGCPAGYTMDNRRLVEQAMAAIQWGRQENRGPVVRYREEMGAAADEPMMNRKEIDRLSREFAAANARLKATYIESAQALVAAVEAKDPYTRAHSEAVARYAEKLSQELDLPESVQQSVRYAATLHDVGKIGVPDQILTKPGPLTPEEFEVVKQHPVIGANIVSHVSCMRCEVPFIQHHHENWDGSGYPAGLRGEAIPLGARILRVADTFDALLSNRSYKEAMDWSDALKEVQAGSGTLYDPRLVTAMSAAFQDRMLLGAGVP